MSRKRTFALLAAFAALAALLSACGGGGGGSSEDPQQVIENATFEGVESGTVDLTMNVKSTGEHGGNLKVDLTGPFQSTGKESLPELALAAKANGEANGEKVNFEGGLTVLGDRAYVGFKGKEYEVEPTIFGMVKSGFEEAEQEGEHESKGGEATACQKAATSLHLEEFVDNLENEGGEEVDGVKTVKLSGDLDPKRGVDTIIKLLETPACTSELEAAGSFPLAELKKQKGEFTNAVKKAHVQVYVGEDDHIVRKVAADLTVEPPGSGEKSEVEFDFTLGEVNEPQTIKAPANAEPLQNLFGELGINPLELLGMMQGGGGDDLGGLLEGITGAIGGGEISSGGGNASGSSGEALSETAEGLSSGAKELQACLSEAESAADVQKCASLME
ncbi:MAG TPA: hypothetical protein VH042_09085 [Solirubrobacterales bacterium]|nr:hypothetical protein [Solirubrobacterales bacterium]